MRPFKLLSFLIVFALLFPDANIWPVSQLNIDGEWIFDITDYPQPVPGNDLKNEYESPTGGFINMDITGSAGANWQVTVRRTDGTWIPASFTLSVRRGTGSYVVIDTTDKVFTTGSDNISNIPLQCRLQGVSVQIPPATYDTTVTYTVARI